MNQETDFIKLAWGSFKTNVPKAFESVRSTGELSDITLACENNGLFGAHRVILASGSVLFQKLLAGCFFL